MATSSREGKYSDGWMVMVQHSLALPVVRCCITTELQACASEWRIVCLGLTELLASEHRLKACCASIEESLLVIALHSEPLRPVHSGTTP